MPDREKNPKKNNRENKKNDLGRPKSEGKNKKNSPQYENFNGDSID